MTSPCRRPILIYLVLSDMQLTIFLLLRNIHNSYISYIILGFRLKKGQQLWMSQWKMTLFQILCSLITAIHKFDLYMRQNVGLNLHGYHFGTTMPNMTAYAGRLCNTRRLHLTPVHDEFVQFVPVIGTLSSKAVLAPQILAKQYSYSYVFSSGVWKKRMDTRLNMHVHICNTAFLGFL